MGIELNIYRGFGENNSPNTYVLINLPKANLVRAYSLKEIIMEKVKATSGNTNTNTDALLSKKAQDVLHDSVDTVAEKAAKAEQAIRDKAHRSAEALSETQDKLKKQWAGSAVGRFAVENPVATVGIAFAAGMLLTALFRKR
ncbi:MAG: ElaB/YqjD/DUF883 family membrane-anchored ribosome-binding protein [Paraglaciecola sp.]|jgi:ElaB/YqjD/DUF883 family membrane-anchored ribosome-binding protein